MPSISEYVAKSNLLDKKHHSNAVNGNQLDPGPFVKRLREFGKGRVRGLIFGPFAEVSTDVEELVSFLADLKSQRWKEGTNADGERAMSMMKNQLVTKLGLFIHRSWARCLLDRACHHGRIDYHSSSGRNLNAVERDGDYGFGWTQEQLEW